MARTVDAPIRNGCCYSTIDEWCFDDSELVDREEHGVFLCGDVGVLCRLWISNGIPRRVYCRSIGYLVFLWKYAIRTSQCEEIRANL